MGNRRWHDATGMQLANISSDVLAQELMRRQRIMWYKARALVADIDSFTTGRAAIIERYRNDMMVQIGNKLLESPVPLFHQQRHEMVDALELRLSVPVFIRT